MVRLLYNKIQFEKCNKIHTIQCNAMLYSRIQCNSIQNILHTIQMQYNVIQNNTTDKVIDRIQRDTIQCHAIQYNTESEGLKGN